MSYLKLADMLTFGRVDFEKVINLYAAKKVKIKSKYKTESLENLVSFQSGLWKGETGSLKRIKVLRNTNFKLNNGKLHYGDVAEIQVSKSQLADRQLQYGDIIIEKSGGSDTQAIGRVVFFDKKDEEYSYSNFCSRIRIHDKKQITPIYLWLVLNDFYNKGGTIPLQNGVRLLNIDMKGYRKVKIPIPPKNIQEKIVAEIEKLEREEHRYNADIEISKKNIDEIISEIKGNLVTLQEITTKIGSGATPRGGEGSYQQSGINLIRSQNIHDNRFVEKGIAFINEQQAAKLDNVKVEKNDILFNITGASITRCCIVDEQFLPARVNQHVSIIRTNEKAVPKYVQRILTSKIYKKQLLQIGEMATSREAITKSQLERFKIPLLQLIKQKQIVLKIEKLEFRINQLETQLKTIPPQKEAILKKYLE